MIRRCNVCNKDYDGSLLSCPDCGIFPSGGSDRGLTSSQVKEVSKQVKKEIYKSIFIWFSILLIVFGFGLTQVYNRAFDKFESTVIERIALEFEEEKIKKTFQDVASIQAKYIFENQISAKVENFNANLESSKTKLIRSVEEARASLRGLGVVIVSLENAAKGGIESVLDNPNFQEEIFNILTGLPSSMFVQYRSAVELFQKENYEDALELVGNLIEEYEGGTPWNLENYSRYEFNKQVNSFYILAAQASSRVGRHKLSYDYSIRALYYRPTYDSFYTAAISAYNNAYYDQSLDMIDRAISLDPPDDSLPLYMDVKERTIEKIEQRDVQ